MDKEMKKYEILEEQIDIVGEPAATYGIKRYSYADYLTWVDNRRREIIDGVVRFMAGPKRKHVEVSHQIGTALEIHIRKNRGKCRVYPAPFDVRLPKNGETADKEIYTVVQPDICVVCDLSKLDDNGCLGAPDLVVEVLSPSTEARDKNDKFHAYRKAGVKEYWIVDVKKSSITVYQLQSDGNYDAGTVNNPGKKVTSSVLPGLEIDLQELFFEL
jgi:Uma2 family endonuclease